MMQGRHDIQERTFASPSTLSAFVKDLTVGHQSLELWSRSFLSGTSVGANVEEAQTGQSRADFISEYSIALKEIRETQYWLRLLAESKIVDSHAVIPLIEEAGELGRILGAIVSRSKQNR
jgi:four helix bundle protein